jgi:hypothetical protein
MYNQIERLPILMSLPVSFRTDLPLVDIVNVIPRLCPGMIGPTKEVKR